MSKNEHYYFGPQSRALFGSCHLPKGHNKFKHGILLCYPFGFEYLRAHRAFRQLAIKLADKGFCVLRFDFYGTGDSIGDLENVKYDLWLEDMQLAVDEIKRISGLDKVCMIGLRLGASIAVSSSAKQPEVDALVLWEPVVRGIEYLYEIAMEARKFSNSGSNEGTQSEIFPIEDYPKEIIGFPMSSALLDDLGRLDLMTIPHGADNVHLVSNTEYPDLMAYYHKIRKRTADVTMNVIEDQKLWLEEPYKALVPVQTLERIINLIIEKVG